MDILFCYNNYVKIFNLIYRTTIGYGDITPANVYEACLLVGGMVIASFTFAVTFNAIGSVVQDI